MQNVFSWILTVLFAGLIFTMFLYVASIVIPVLLLLVLIAFLVLRYRQHRALKIIFDTQKKAAQQSQKPDIIDVEYEVIDNNRR